MHQIDSLPAAQLAGSELDLRLLVDHRERLVRQRTALANDVRWQLHDLWPELALPARALFSRKWLSKAPAFGSPATSCVAELSRTIDIGELVTQAAPQLLDEPGCGPLTAAKLARAAGLAPIPVSSGRTNRHRLDRGGNRQINAAIDRIALTRSRIHPKRSRS